MFYIYFICRKQYQKMLDFIGIGAQKAGTTWIYENLAKHHEIFFPNGKEMHFWNKVDIGNQDKIEEYIKSFTLSSNSQSLIKKQGEITPAYAFLEQNVIKEIYKINPNLKIIYSVRNPIDRAWSGALMALKRAEMTIDEASDQWFIDHFKSEGSLQRGDYETCLNTWSKIFPAENFLIINFDDITKNPKDVLKKCAIHIGVSDNFFNDISYEDISKKIYSGLNQPKRKKLQKKLENLYKDKIKSGKKYLFLKDIFQDF